jgi:hypothetical protein
VQADATFDAPNLVHEIRSDIACDMTASKNSITGLRPNFLWSLHRDVFVQRSNLMLARRTMLASLVCAAVSAHIATASAQVYPTRPITMIVPFPAGGQRIRSHALCRSG